MAEVKKIGRHTYRRLTDEEARREYGSSFVFVGPAKPTTEARGLLKKADAALEQLREIRKAALKTNAKKSNRSPK
jgi:hypothetical protein